MRHIFHFSGLSKILKAVEKVRNYVGKSTGRHEIGRSDSGIASVQALQHQDGGFVCGLVPAVREIS
jgi:hypothetical protein